MDQPDPTSLTTTQMAELSAHVEKLFLEHADAIDRLAHIPAGAIFIGMLTASAKILSGEWRGDEAGLLQAWQDAYEVGLEEIRALWNHRRELALQQKMSTNN